MGGTDILIETSRACSIHFYDPYLAAAWIKTLIGNIKPDDYLDIFRALHPMDPDALTNARHWIEKCFGGAI